ncbi:DUF2157 domain-containing protein [Actinopolyspora erythraea]|uniref:DUF2157 domain-containing protein n=1 Tax=Actinopolyspora erythraea TaxID=414996 RepID=UPI0012FD798B|nr:DUF2157 domain-containing protein [Actinopolyspora erythraea]
MSATTNRRQRAALYRLVGEGVLTAEQAEAALAALRRSEPRRGVPAGAPRETAGYVGGALVLAGGGLLAELTYETLARSTRAGILLGVTLLFAVTARYLLGRWYERRERTNVPGARRRLAALLFALGALTGGSAVWVAVAEHASLSATVTGLVLALLGYLAVPAPAGLLATAVAAVATVHSFTDFWFRESLPGGPSAPEFAHSELTGVLLLVVGTLWCVLALRRALAAPTFALSLGVVVVLLGSVWVSSLGRTWWGHALALVVAGLLLAGFVSRRELVLLVGGVVGLVMVVRDTVPDLLGEVGVSVLVLLVGALVLLFGAFAVRRPGETSSAPSDTGSPEGTGRDGTNSGATG